MTASLYRCYSCQTSIRNEATVKFCPQCGSPLILQGKYRLLRILGRGGFGIVFEAVDMGLERQLAIKKIMANDSLLQRHALAEARLLAKHARHTPFIPEIYDVWDKDKDVYLAMEYIGGQTLQDVFDKDGPWSPAEVKKFLRIILKHLAHLHEARVIHRDIKPENIKKTPDGRYVLLDFGIAKQGSTTSTRMSTQSLSPTMLAFTPYYAPLEQEQGLRTDARSDLYSLGVTAYFLLTGRLPDRSPHRFLQGNTMIPPGKLVNNVPRSLDRTIMAMLEVLHENRPQDATFALAMLEDTASTRPQLIPSTVKDLVEMGRVGGGWLSHMTFSPDGRVLAIASFAGIELWDTATWNRVNSIKEHSAPVRFVAFSPDGQLLASASDDGSIRLWKRDGTIVRILQGHTSRVRVVVFSPDGQSLASGSDDGTLRIWRTDGTLQRTIQEHLAVPGSEHRPVAGLYALAWKPDGQLIVSASSEEILVWTTRGDTYTLLRGHTGPVNMLTWSSDGQTLASASDDGTLRTWQMQQTISRKPFAYHEGRVCAVAFSPDGSLLVSTTDDGAVCLWRNDGMLVNMTRTHTGETTAVAWRPDGQMFATMSINGEVRLWFANGSLSHMLRRDGPYTGVPAWSSDGQTLAAATTQKTIHMLNADGSLRHTLYDHTEAITSLAWSPPGEVLISTSRDRTIRWWDVHGTARRIFSMQNRPVLHARWSPDGRYLVSIAEGMGVSVWTTDGTVYREIQCPALSVCWHPTEHVFALCAETVIIYRVDGTSIGERPGKVAAWSPDGKTLATGEYGKLLLWNWNEQSYALRATLTGTHTDWVVALCWRWHADYTLASGAEDGTICLWRADGTLLASLAGHTDWITALAWTPHDGQILASASHDGTVRIWLADGGCVRVIKQYAESLAWSPDGAVLAMVPGDGTIAFWGIETSER